MFSSFKWLPFVNSVLSLVLMDKLPEDCGRQIVSSPVPRIIGGEDAVHGEFPWQVQIIRYYTEVINNITKPNAEICGGTIISPKWILTAGHCIKDDTKNDDLEVSYNTIKTNSWDNYGIKVTVVDIKRVANFTNQVINNSLVIKNDVTLLKINETFDFRKARPICLYNQTNTSLVTDCVATGYGIIFQNKTGQVTLNRVAQSLKVVQVTLLNDSDCSSFKGYDKKGSLCARGYKKGETNACMGDSGGPLQCKGKNNRYYQIGVTSYGLTNCTSGPSVFAKVSNYYNEIVKIIDN